MFRKVATFLVVSLMAVLPCLAQRDLGTLTGIVADSSGGVVPNAKVTLTEEATGQKYTLTTDDTGAYVRPALQPGTYTVDVEAPGFSQAVQRGVLVTGGARIAVNIQLTLGKASETVEVTSSAPLLQTESTLVGQALPAKSVGELPLGGQRNPIFLARLSTGVLPVEPNGRDTGTGGFSANGVAGTGNNNFMLNGVDNNNNVMDLMSGTSYVVGPPPEAIGEMRIIINGQNAEYGRAAGGVVDVSLKSGTNAFHGAAWEYLQNDKLNANRWESNRVGRSRGAVRQNQFGGSAGGPVIKNRTFWFGDYQAARVRSTAGAVRSLGSLVSTTIPRAAFKNGDFSSLLGSVSGTDALGRPVAQGQIYDITTTRALANGSFVRDPFVGNIIPMSMRDPAAQRLINQFPDPNQNLTTRVPGSNYGSSTSGTQSVDQFDIRVDHRLTSADNLFGSISWAHTKSTQTPVFPGDLDGETQFANELNLNRNAMLSWSRVWTPAILSETRLAFTRAVLNRTSPNADTDLFKKYGIGGFDPVQLPDSGGLMSIRAEGYSNFGTRTYRPTIEYSNVWNFIQNVAVNKGRHAMKFGFESRSIQLPFSQFEAPRGTMNFNRDRTSSTDPRFSGSTGDGYASFLLGYPSTGSMSTTNFISSFRKSYAVYAQTDWKATTKLTINLGVRYELYSPTGERFGRQANFNFDTLTLNIPKGKDQDTPMPSTFAASFPMVNVVRGQVGQYLIPWDKTSVGPRIGIAWHATPKTVIRLGYGIFYSGEVNEGGDPNRGVSLPFNKSVNLNNPLSTFQINPRFGTFSDGFPLDVFNSPAPPKLRGVADDYRNGLVHKWNFAIQRELGWQSAFELSYIGNHMAHLNGGWDPNTAPARPDLVPGSVSADSLRPVPVLSGQSVTYSFGYGNYGAMGAKLEKRAGGGLTFVASYTWSHTLSTTGTQLSGPEGGFSTRGDLRDQSTRYASAAWDIRHSYTTGFNWEVPVGKGRKFGSGMNRAFDAVAGGWQTNGILTFRTGTPYGLTSRLGSGYVGTITPNIIPGRGFDDAPPGGRTPAMWFDTSAFTAPAPNTQGTVGNQTQTRPGQKNIDFSVFKDISISERFKLQLRGEAFNLFNTPYFAKPGSEQGAGDFGVITSTVDGSERRMQVALRLRF